MSIILNRKERMSAINGYSKFLKDLPCRCLVDGNNEEIKAFVTTHNI